jgi:hypothetical protein
LRCQPDRNGAFAHVRLSQFSGASKAGSVNSPVARASLANPDASAYAIAQRDRITSRSVDRILLCPIYAGANRLNKPSPNAIAATKQDCATRPKSSKQRARARRRNALPVPRIVLDDALPTIEIIVVPTFFAATLTYIRACKNRERHSVSHFENGARYTVQFNLQKLCVFITLPFARVAHRMLLPNVGFVA